MTGLDDLEPARANLFTVAALQGVASFGSLRFLRADASEPAGPGPSRSLFSKEQLR